MALLQNNVRIESNSRKNNSFAEKNNVEYARRDSAVSQARNVATSENVAFKSRNPKNNLVANQKYGENTRRDSILSQARIIETVKEDPTMSENMILSTKPIDEIRRQFPVQGLAKRMSIAASDLIGKSHGELTLLLIQLNREKSNLKHLYDYNSFLLQTKTDEYEKSSSAEEKNMINLRKSKIFDDISDIEYQLNLGQPLITFIDNIVKLSSLYAGDDLMFATEYRSHLLNSDELRPLRDNVNFMRKIQERNVSNEVHKETEFDDVENNVVQNDYQVLLTSESSEFQKTCNKLQAELNNLMELNKKYHAKKLDLMQYINRVQSVGLCSSNSRGNKQEKSESYLETDLDTKRTFNLAAKYPRRMDRQSLRRSATLNLQRQQSTRLNVYGDRRHEYHTLPQRWLEERKSLSSNQESTSNINSLPNQRRLSSSSSTLPDDVFVDSDSTEKPKSKLSLQKLNESNKTSVPTAL